MSNSQQEVKEKAKKRDDHECQFCGVANEQHVEEYDRGLSAHHIIKTGDDGKDKPENLITVCRGCHKTLEHTQADALSRIREEHTAEYEKEIDGLKQELKEQRELVGAYRGFVEWLFTGRLQEEIHVVFEGAIAPPQPKLVTTDVGRATDEYKDSDRCLTLSSASVTISDFPKLINEKERVPDSWGLVSEDIANEQINDRVTREAQQ